MPEALTFPTQAAIGLGLLDQANAEVVMRPRLIKRLNRTHGSRLILISPPAGSGKTTLLSEWIPQSKRCVAWLSLHESENDPVRFWTYFVSAQFVEINLKRSLKAGHLPAGQL